MLSSLDTSLVEAGEFDNKHSLCHFFDTSASLRAAFAAQPRRGGGVR